MNPGSKFRRLEGVNISQPCFTCIKGLLSTCTIKQCLRESSTRLLQNLWLIFSQLTQGLIEEKGCQLKPTMVLFDIASGQLRCRHGLYDMSDVQNCERESGDIVDFPVVI